MTSDQLRELAAHVRKVASDQEAAKTARVANTLKAAHALNLLRKKVASNAQ
jgi:hypothetical protein